MIKKEKIFKEIRLRFPPSPTGPLHIGNARTILFNYLFAKQNNGKTILRIEDTDKERSDLKWVQNIIEELKWLGIEWSEGPDIDGKFGPYKQSQRLEIYKKYLNRLLEEKNAYFCNCDPKDLESKREDQVSRGLAPKYDGTCRDKNLPAQADNKSGVIRFKVENKKVKFNDLIRGDVEFDTGLLGDIVIAKDKETPLYHFAVVVDDYEMQISHIIRGEDHISNTPKQILLQEALGFYQPIYAHLPLMLNPDKSKMSKRVGDVSVSDYHKNGYLPEALINFMVFLGWNPGTDKEIFSLNELVREFSLEKVQKAGAVFNVAKLDSINSYYIREKQADKLIELCLPYLPKEAENLPKKTLEKIIEAYRLRMKKLSDITELTDFLFVEKLEYDKNLLKWKEMDGKDVKEALLLCDTLLSKLDDSKWNAKNLEKILLPEAEKFNQKMGYDLKNRGYLLWPLRVALSGKSASAGPFEIAEILGKEKTLVRIQQAY